MYGDDAAYQEDDYSINDGYQNSGGYDYRDKSGGYDDDGGGGDFYQEGYY